MIRLTDLKIPVEAVYDPRNAAARMLRIDAADLTSFAVRRRSLDARKKSAVNYVLTVDVSLRDASDEKRLLKKHGRSLKLSVPDETPYTFPYASDAGKYPRPVIVGFGPAGLFCAYELAAAGFAPIVIERGAPVEERVKEIDRFWAEGTPDPDSNVCFGEGGAGAFSDGKLNTGSSDPLKRSTHVLETFVKFGADEEILSWYRPHIGTDALRPIIKHMRAEIIRLGGEVRFHTRLDGIEVSSDLHAGTEPKISGIRVTDLQNGRIEKIDCSSLILAIGHSASDTYRMLCQTGVPMRQKPFAVGFRVQHPQEMIDRIQYGNQAKYLPHAEYRLRTQFENRGVYSFCMCPGGFVVDSSSSPGLLCINGMSYHDRAGENANSAIVVSVGPEDFKSTDPLGGLQFQQQLELQAFRKADGQIPVCRYGDLYQAVTGEKWFMTEISDADLAAKYPDPAPQFQGRYALTDLSGVLQPELEHVFIGGMTDLGRKLPGFNAPGVLLAGVESRTSSPIRIDRDDSGQSVIRGVFPCGEGAGYAGGIMSAAVDGILIAEKVASGLIESYAIK